jgi:hypothetical protein
MLKVILVCSLTYSVCHLSYIEILLLHILICQGIHPEIAFCCICSSMENLWKGQLTSNCCRYSIIAISIFCFKSFYNLYYFLCCSKFTFHSRKGVIKCLINEIDVIICIIIITMFMSIFNLSSKILSNSNKMKNGVFWDVTLCGSCKNPCFGGTSSGWQESVN